MDFHEFSHLTGTDQLKAVGHRGVFLVERFTPEGRCIIYRVRNFFVELLFVSRSDDQVQVTSYTMGHPRFLRMLCLLPAASLRSIAEKARVSPLSFVWN